MDERSKILLKKIKEAVIDNSDHSYELILTEFKEKGGSQREAYELAMSLYTTRISIFTDSEDDRWVDFLDIVCGYVAWPKIWPEILTGP